MEVDLGAIAANVGVLAETVAPSALWVVVKADGYGHGAAPVARAALEAGADGLCVAFVQEGAALRQAGILGPILVLSEQPVSQLQELVRWHLAATAYSASYLDALAEEARESGGPTVRVHVKVDTGMHRVGAPPSEVVPLVQALVAHPELRWDGLWTHLARADEVHDPMTVTQLAMLDEAATALETAGYPPPIVHAANSAGALAWGPAARRDLVRAGIAVYGIAPSAEVAPMCGALEPALALKARVSHVQRVAAGEGVSYGHQVILARDANIATLPLGYADGVPRRLPSVGGEVLLGGRRRPIAGVVTMDQLMIDCGDDDVVPGDEAVLIGAQGSERITADDWASALGTIAYEVVCGLSPRLPRIYRGEEPEPA
ncbi:MAG TPA: alanine racemase [Acidimicrobiales bacterium]